MIHSHTSCSRLQLAGFWFLSTYGIAKYDRMLLYQSCIIPGNSYSSWKRSKNHMFQTFLGCLTQRFHGIHPYLLHGLPDITRKHVVRWDQHLGYPCTHPWDPAVPSAGRPVRSARFAEFSDSFSSERRHHAMSGTRFLLWKGWWGWGRN